MSADADRKFWMGLLAKAPAEALAALWRDTGLDPAHRVLRAPEIGGVMVRGRMGGTGSAFNLGEMTVTRCAVRLDSGEVGHGYVQGRDKAKAKVAALVDALMQTGAADGLRASVLQPLQCQAAARRAHRADRADKTKVDFFTMVRGED